MKIKKKIKNFFWGGGGRGGGGGLVGVGWVWVGGGGGVELGLGGGQGGCERRIEVFGKIQKKKIGGGVGLV